ncbi:odorant receptor 82a [Diachasma alloeum]|uniref:Odorant receptor n=1 Tax=Diachasma alloeum TaxID=454923 RepID=A0A4E0S3S4_9HYME|nr:odorant receptor 82a [Diachasma alloeum]THK33035.1 olfactory receptor 8 [Diachasma alloeum]
MTPEPWKQALQFPPIHQHEANINYELQYTRWLLTALGVWPMITNDVTRRAKISSILLVGLSLLAIAFILVPITVFMFVKMKTLRTRLGFIGPIGFRISNMCKIIMMMYRSGVIRECISQVKSDWSAVTIRDDEDAMVQSVILGRSLTIVCGIFMLSGGVFFHIIMPLLKPRKVNAFNVTIRPHAYPGYDFFVDSQATPAYEIIFSAHFLCATSGYVVVTASCNLAAVFVSHISGQVQVIKLKLARVQQDDGGKAGDLSRQIASIVKSHVRILKFSDKIKMVFREICLVEVVLSTIVICWLEFYCITEWKNSATISIVGYCVILGSFSFNVFIYCYIGQILTDQCESVGQMAYMIDWHRIPPRNVLSLSMIISMARYPRHITAGGMINLTIRSFGDVMKTSVAYLNVLTAVAA